MSTFASSEDADEIQHNAAFHLGLHCFNTFAAKHDCSRIYRSLPNVTIVEI